MIVIMVERLLPKNNYIFYILKSLKVIDWQMDFDCNIFPESLMYQSFLFLFPLLFIVCLLFS